MNANKLTAGLVTAGIAFGGAASAEAAPVDSHQNPQAAAASFGWAHVGGDPLVKGGIETRQDYVNLVTSTAGGNAMKLMGLSKAQRAEWKLSARQGKEVACGKHTGDHFDKMSYGAGGASVDTDVTLTDQRFVKKPLEGFCLDVTVGDTTLKTFVAKICANETVVDTVPAKRPHPKAKKNKTAPVKVNKTALTEKSEIIKKTPTDTFEFRIKCLQKGKLLVRRSMLNRPNQVLANCDVGTGKNRVVEVEELATHGPDKWVSLTNNVQKQVVKAKGNTFNFKDQQEAKPTTPPVIDNSCEGNVSGNTTNNGVNNGVGGNAQGGNCSVNINCAAINSPLAEVCVTPLPPVKPPKPNLPPSVDLIGPQHVLVDGQIQICAFEKDPEGDIVDTSFAEKGNGNFISAVYDGDEAGEKCVDFKAGTVADTETVTVTVRDSANNTASDSETFPIYDGPKGQF